MLNSLQNELTRMGFHCGAPEIIRSQNGVTVARVSDGGGSCVLKFFERPEFRREIEACRLLGSLGVPTIRVLARTDSALLLEDLSASPCWRLAEAKDMADCELAERLAEWYVCLHTRARKRPVRRDGRFHAGKPRLRAGKDRHSRAAHMGHAGTPV